jgi:hypothetical protein
LYDDLLITVCRPSAAAPKAFPQLKILSRLLDSPFERRASKGSKVNSRRFGDEHTKSG